MKIHYYYHNIDKLIKKVVDRFIGILKNLTKLVKKLGETLISLVKNLSKWLIGLVKKLFDLILKGLNWVLSKIKAFFEGIAKYFASLLKYFGELAKWLFTKSFVYFVYFILGIFNLGLTILLDFGAQALKMIASIPVKIVEKVLFFIPEPVKGAVMSPLKKGLEQLFKPGSKGIKIDIDADKLLKDLEKQIGKAFEDAGKAAADAGKGVLNAIGIPV